MSLVLWTKVEKMKVESWYLRHEWENGSREEEEEEEERKKMTTDFKMAENPIMAYVELMLVRN